MKFMSKIAAAILLSSALAGCGYQTTPDPTLSAQDSEWVAMVPNPPIDPNYNRYMIDYKSDEKPGTIIIDTKVNYLYYILGNNKAIRYGVATGSEAAGWTGEATVGRKAEWPHWMPPADMLERWPHLKPTADAGGLPGGPDNPLGARALYLYQGNTDTLYRIHGTNEPEAIGHSVSSGCIRMRNIDAIDLYNRVEIGAKVVVL
ncbi:L,D-transpeptidase [Methylovirgula sp. 4M-Z18]|uniref:L,D-transpeptidase n=1 Tax=Methylovirgula sp. 4M-Z18 TaxID=2293567 RepID=UPI000E2E6E8D|nr:L,D-transpeptidase [Methylovirgula sp. 4M-Z18]RFB80140.1 L,D-transpeptidase [Methylovirgula sp. 4M-Z18]